MDIYCGADKLKKNQRRGNMKECSEKKQIRYFGIYKVDPKTLKSVKDKSVIPSTRNKLILRLSKLKGIINRNKGRYEKARESNPNKDNYYLEWKKADKELIQVTNKLRKMEKKGSI